MSDLPIILVTVPTPPSVLDDPDFAPAFVFTPLAHAKARARTPGATVAFIAYRRLSAPPGGTHDLAETRWYVHAPVAP